MIKQSNSLPGKGPSPSKNGKGKGKAKVEQKGKVLSELRNVDSDKLDKGKSGTGGRSAEPISKVKSTNNKRKSISTKVEAHERGGKRPSKKPRGICKMLYLGNNYL